MDGSKVLTSDAPARFERVSAAAPPTIVSEAVRLTDKRAVLYPWEKGRLGRIFGEQGRLSLKKPKLHAGVNNFVEVGVEVDSGFKLGASVSVQQGPTEKAIYLSVVRNIIGCSFAEERESQRDHAIRQWWDLLKLNMACSDPGRAAVHEHGLVDVCRYGIELLDAIFALKSPNTLLKRLCAVKLFGQWVIRNFAEAWIPLQETRVWSYVRHLREIKAPASRAVSLLESVRFCHYTLRVDGALEVLESLRIKGLAAQLFSSKRPWKPSDVLTVNEVEFLHHCFNDQTRSEIDRIFIGHMLHMLYARARFSDLLSVTDLFLDEDEMFFEVSATLHKGARSMDARSKLLPIVAPAFGLKGGNWAKDYLNLRKKAGLCNPANEAAPMVLARKRAAMGWDSRYVTSQELNKFIQKLFAEGGRPIAGRKLTSHSLKATGLSWCSKMGVPQEHRAILARHATSVQGATVLYSRDLITTALRSFNGVLEAIRSQMFQPDRTRSGMITPARATPAGAPATPLPPCEGLKSTGHEMDGLDLVEQILRAPDQEPQQVEQLDVTGEDPVERDGLEPYSPGTPVDSVAVKEEFQWPDYGWDETVIDLDMQHDLCAEPYEGSEEESSSCSDSDDSDVFEWGSDNVGLHSLPLRQWGSHSGSSM